MTRRSDDTYSRVAAKVIDIISSLPPEAVIGDVFLFGSALSKEEPADIDILLIIDELSITPSTAYCKAEPMTLLIEAATGKPVDLTILTNTEEANSQFSETVNAHRILKRLLSPPH